ncbi:uncharacterized protein LOC117306372 isoform X1 [Asterias rubens]|uniref:uncharacterized protein LOC117306372 isoform X1 n=1 Tax=Asterias rubens TaxID=7604 RepID=UPI0014557CCB|nr:uncharacterized protein LOC117306372 isoform X1 [Asterias rubens]
MADDAFDCLPCTGGMYCEGEANEVPTAKCDPGWYCSSGAFAKRPVPNDNTTGDYSVSECPIYTLNNTGDICPPGTYCPEGSQYPTPCPKGKFCEGYANEIYDGSCTAGFFCNGSASVTDPVPCSKGHYCPEGTEVEEPCEPGTYSDREENTNISYCLSCTPGMYCEEWGMELPSAECSRGYYCPGGQDAFKPVDLACSPGHFCEVGSWNQTGCPSGWYQQHWGRYDCNLCPKGAYCRAYADYELLDDENVTLSGNFSGRYRSYRGVSDPEICPPGSYCPSGTMHETEYLCPEGTYSNSTGLHNATQCTLCDPGMYCPGQGNTYSYAPCTAGYFCTSGAASSTPTDGVTGNICPAGKYCPQGSIAGEPCPKGTFSNELELMNAGQCQNCTGGYYCDRSGLKAETGECWAGHYCSDSSEEAGPVNQPYGDLCWQGHYCPNGTAYPETCPPGTYLDAEGQGDVSDCISCRPGYYCDQPGQTNVTAECDAGYFCSLRANNSAPTDGVTGDRCWVGHYCEVGSSHPTPCTNGTYYNKTGAEECDICPAGYQCIHGDTADPCPQGYYCPTGTGYGLRLCPTGYYGNREGLRQEDECTPCTGGHFCATPGQAVEDGECSPGHYCELGVDTQTPTASDGHKGIGGICPAGSYCPTGTVTPHECDAGSFTASEGQSSCSPCTAGYYCPANTSDPTMYPCSAGYYCPLETGYETEFPCPEGTYNSLTLQQNGTSCELCTPGMYCEGEGLDQPTGNCSEGWFCTGGAVTSTPLPTGNASVISDCSCPAANYTGNKCYPGTYCPAGSVAPVDCTAGWYCDDHELATPKAMCNAGYYCPGGNDGPEPPGMECPPGYYCETGVGYPIACPNGTFSNTSKNTELSNCLSCTPGSYCAGEHLCKPSSLCGEGYYCPGGQITDKPLEYVCWQGFRCPVGSPIPELCPRGTYQSEEGQGSCKVCLEGTYCDPFELGNVTGVISPPDCIPGHYCPNGTEFAQQNKCPIGTYSNKTALAREDQCDDCDFGWYCDNEGLTAPTAQCQAGYYCQRGAQKPDPEDGFTGDICPMGSFCVEGSATSEDCPIGSYGNDTGLKTSSECPLCDPGWFCPTTGLTSPGTPCFAGFYCTLGATNGNPDGEAFGYKCPEGHYCPTGTPVPVPCVPGTYNPDVGKDDQSDCKACDGGYYCQYDGQPNVTAMCNEGFYCSGNASIPNPEDGVTGDICPIGHYCPKGIDRPLPCLNATYMNRTGAAECLDCPAGSYCTQGDRPDPCPAGYYCPMGTGFDTRPCPEGTYGASESLRTESECSACTGGSYCDTPGMDSVTADCDPGFFCLSGVDVRTPNGIDNLGFGGICQAGYKCPQGSAAEIPCYAGSYAGQAQMDDCDICPEGKYCENITVVPSDCPAGHYCPDGTEFSDQYPCQPGTYNNATGQGNVTSCKYCPPGWFCESAGLVEPSGQCDPGFYCNGGSDEKRPFDEGELVSLPTSGYLFPNDTCHPTFDCVCPAFDMSTGGLCGPGYYCPIGSPAAQNCRGGMYCETPGLEEPTGNCSAGFYCNHTSTVPDQYICPAGHYCEVGTAVPTPCPEGMFSRTEMNTGLNNCENCTAGSYCEGEGNVEPDAECTMGYYCPGGQTSATPSDLKCPRGYSCPQGSWEPQLCDNGTYQGQLAQGECDICPGGSYCDPYEVGPVINPSNCPQGYYCPPGTRENTTNPCPEGTYGETIGYDIIDDCVQCPERYYCGTPALQAPTAECYAGYYCTSGSSSPTPYDDMVDPDNNSTFTGNDVCPIGYFCTNGTAYPEPCPPGTFSTNTRVTSVDGCEDCPRGRYCNMQGFVKVDSAPDCAPGYVCTGGSTTPTPAADSGKGYPCPAGHYCPEGTLSELGCPVGTYQSNTGQSNCTLCPDGLMCETVNLTAPSECKTGHYCQEGSPLPIPCPPGTFNNITSLSLEEQCTDCIPGMYCEGPGNSYPTGLCNAGYYCQGRAETKIPVATIDYPENGPCPAGFYCDEGIPAPTQCPVGTVRRVEGASSIDDCSPCPGGFYCEDPGQIDPTGPCSAGFYCPANESITNPAPIGLECPIGHYCTNQTTTPTPCSVGTYQPNIGRDSCIDCQAGFYCESALFPDPKPCPAYHYCPAATRYPITCANGTFTYDTDEGLKEQYECLPCLAGSYCRGGQLQGNCSEGYFCLSQSYDYTPDGLLPDVDNFDEAQCPPNTTCAGPCPPGHYCPAGIVDPVPCKNNTWRPDEFGSRVEDCEPCPAGEHCLEGDPILYPCPLGHYCEEGIGPVECPIYHYRDVVGAASEGDCYNCKAGFYCQETGMTNSSFLPCYEGHYCEEGTTEPQPCTGGRMSTTTGRVSNEDCPLCTPGYYCPNDTINIHGIPCRPTYECPEGAAIEVTCRPGHYCEGVTGDPPLCPGGNYCPLGSSAYTQCFYPKYCPEGSEVPLECPLGSRAMNHAGLRVYSNESCNLCPAGTYGNHTERFECAQCIEGYYCPIGTGNPENFPCPIGYYCPAGSGEPFPCPAGLYGNIIKAIRSDQCQPCPANTFNNMLGQKACRPCGSSAAAQEGSVTCDCTGKYRSFQTTSGSCVCWSGYVFYNEVDLSETEGNNDGDCQLKVDDRCELSQARDASERKCVDPGTYDCTVMCGADDGTFDVDLGRCTCNTYIAPEEICDSSCEQTKPTVQGSLSSSGQLVVTSTANDGSGDTITMPVPNVIGPSVHTSGTKDIQIVSFESTGAMGHIVSDMADLQQLILDDSEDVTAIPTISSNRRRRRLLAETPTTVPGIPNPIICLALEDMMIFRVAINSINRNQSNYPVYQKDHLFNTNPTYDYSEFRDLQFYVENTAVAISAFAHVFTESGQYVFADAQEAQWEVIVSVQAPGAACDTTQSVVQPSTAANLAIQNVKKLEAQNEEPDWGLIIGMLSFLAACIIMLVIAVIVWRPRSAGIYPLKMWKPKYRALGAPPRIPPYLQYQDTDREALLLGPRIVEGAESTVRSEKGELEDFNVRTLYDKLEDQTLYLAQQLTRQQEDLRGFYERMSQQTDGLKGLLLSLDMSKLEKIEKERARKAEREGYQASGDTTNIVNTNRQYNFTATGASSRENELMEALGVLLEHLNTGKIPLSPEMLQQAGLGPAGGVASMGVVSGKGAAVDGLLKRQNKERMQLSNDLRSKEEEEINGSLTDFDKKRQKLISDLSCKLASKLDGADTQQEIDKIMSSHEKEMSRALDKFDSAKQRQVEDLRKRLAEKRQVAEANMKSRHQQEASDAGITLTQEDSSDAAGILKEQELEIDTILADEALARAKAQASQNRELAIEQQHKMSENLTAAIESLASTGVLTAESTQDIVKDQADMEKALEDRMSKRRSQLTSNMKQRMAEKRRKKLRKLKDDHKDQMDASSQTEAGYQDADKLGPLADPEAIKELEERQRKEVDALESKLEAEEAEQIKEIERQVNEEYTKDMKKGHRDILENVSKNHDVDQVLQQQLMDQLRRTNENIAYDLNIQKDRHESDLNAKLDARRERKKMEARRVAQEVAAKRLLAEQAKQMDKMNEGKLVEGLQSLSPAEIADLSLEEQSVIREHQRIQEDLKIRQKEDREQLAEKLTDETRKKEEGEGKQFERERTKLLSEKRNKQAAELAARRGDMSDEEAGQLLASHARELEELEDRIENDRARALLTAREKLAERRRRLLNEQKRKQGVEMARELLEQKKELAEVKSEVVKKVEHDAMLEGIQSQGAENTEKVIRAVLDKRQAQELNDLDAQFGAERQVAIEGALTKLNDKYHGKRESMLQRHERELSDLSKKDLSPDEMEQKKAALLNQQQLELSKLEREFAQEKRDIEQGALADWELRYARSKLSMKERHYQEYADALRDLSGDQANQMVSAEQAAKAAQELEDVRQRLEKEREANEEKIKKEREDFEAAEKVRMAQELSEFDSQLSDEEKKEKERNAKRLAALNKRKEEMVKEKQQKHKEKLEALQKSGGSKEDQEKLIEEYERDLSKMKNKMDADRVRMQSDLQDRLKKRREERRKAKEEDLVNQKEENRQEHEEQIKQEEEQMRTNEVIALKECVDTDHLLSEGVTPGITYESTQGNAAFPSGYSSVAPLSDADLAALLMASPLYKKLEDIKKTMDDADLPPKKRGQDEPFVDDHDAAWTQDTELLPIDLSKLNARNFIIYKFGCFVIKLVATNCSHNPVTLLLADKIPVNDKLARNAYRNSYHYDDANRILYVRQARLDIVGEFIIVLVHALAHIKTGDMRDDTSASFNRNFHQALSVICNDLFFARYRHNATLPSVPEPGSSEGGHKVLEALMGSVETGSEKDETVEKLLDVKLLRGTDEDGVRFTNDRLQERLSKYSSFAVSDAMKSLLGSTDGKSHLARQHGTDDEIEKRLATLMGTPAPSASNAPEVLAKKALLELPGELSGTAMWQSVAGRSGVRNQAERRSMKAATGPDQQKNTLQAEVKIQEDKVDRMSEEFSDLNMESVKLHDSINEMAQELQSQKQLMEGQFDESEPALIRATTAKLSDAKDKLTSLTVQRENISTRLSAHRSQLEEKQQQLQSYVRKSGKK